MKRQRSLGFYKLLHQIEYEIGSECYNGNIQNFGPGGEWEGEGRRFRYPVRYINSKGEHEKYRGEFPAIITSKGSLGHGILGEEKFHTAHYAFGENELYILRGIARAIERIEQRFGIDFDELLKSEVANSK